MRSFLKSSAPVKTTDDPVFMLLVRANYRINHLERTLAKKNKKIRGYHIRAKELKEVISFNEKDKPTAEFVDFITKVEEAVSKGCSFNKILHNRQTELPL